MTVLVHEQQVKFHTCRDEQEVRCHQQLISAGDDDFSAELLTVLVLIKNTFYIISGSVGCGYKSRLLLYFEVMIGDRRPRDSHSVIGGRCFGSAGYTNAIR
jgi:hypothetical protein